MTTRYDISIEEDRHGDYVSFEDYTSLDNDHQCLLDEYNNLVDRHDCLLAEYEDLKWRMDGLEK